MAKHLLSSSFSLNFNLGRVVDAAGKELDYGYYAAAYGIAFAIQTCRVSAVIQEKLEALTVSKLSKLLDKMVGEKLSIGDVPRWLISEMG